jgi:hypothetical protein
LTKEPRPFNDIRMVFSAIDAGTVECPHTQKNKTKQINLNSARPYTFHNGCLKIDLKAK